MLPNTCRPIRCRQQVCFFAHSEDELRTPSSGACLAAADAASLLMQLPAECGPLPAGAASPPRAQRGPDSSSSLGGGSCGGSPPHYVCMATPAPRVAAAAGGGPAGVTASEPLGGVFTGAPFMLVAPPAGPDVPPVQSEAQSAAQSWQPAAAPAPMQVTSGSPVAAGPAHATAAEQLLALMQEAQASCHLAAEARAAAAQAQAAAGEAARRAAAYVAAGGAARAAGPSQLLPQPAAPAASGPVLLMPLQLPVAAAAGPQMPAALAPGAPAQHGPWVPLAGQWPAAQGVPLPASHLAAPGGSPPFILQQPAAGAPGVLPAGPVHVEAVPSTSGPPVQWWLGPPGGSP